MSNQSQVLFRDFQVANDVKHMMKMRFFEKEFTMYGCLFFENGEKKYYISSDKNKVVSFLDNKAEKNRYPFPIISKTLLTTVPSGNEEEIVRVVKVMLAKHIRNEYSDAFVEKFLEFADVEPDHAAESILDALQDKMYGLFRADNLLLFEALMDKAYRAKHLGENRKQYYEEWMAEEWRQMENDAQEDASHAKILYGFAYRENGTIKVYCNGIKERVYERMLKIKNSGHQTGPMYTKSYYYKLGENIGLIKQQYEEFLKELFDDTFFAQLDHISTLPSVIDKERYQKFAEEFAPESEAQAEAVEYYRHEWGIGDNKE